MRIADTVPVLVMVLLSGGCGGDDEGPSEVGPPLAYHIEGTVTWEDGPPIEGAPVYLSTGCDADDDEYAYQSPETQTDSQGWYEIDWQPPCACYSRRQSDGTVFSLGVNVTVDATPGREDFMIGGGLKLPCSPASQLGNVEVWCPLEPEWDCP